MMEPSILAQKLIQAVKESDASNSDQIWYKITEEIVLFIKTYAEVQGVTLIAPPNGGSVQGVAKIT